MLRILSLFPLFLHAAYGVTISSNTRTDLFVVDQDVSPDGFTRPAVVAGTTATNAAVVGPLITGSRGGKYSINVHDQLTNVDMLKGTSIHWHGLLQRTTTWADGPSFVNQCPISPGHSFTYTFSSPDQAGTFWYHSHLGLQYCDGLRGPFVVYDKNDPHARRYDVDDETTVITLADWYHKLAKDFAGPAIPDAILINGKGRYSGGPASDLSVVTVQRNKRYRMRLVSMSCDANYVFQIVGHSLTIIEADGVSTHPHTVHSLQIFAGQRYSFVLKADQPVGNYWIRANPNIGNGLPNNFAGGLNSGILRYVGAPNAEPTATADATDLLLETDLHALTSPKVPGKPKPGGADVNINLVMGFSNGGFTINGVGFKSPTVPVLNQIMSGVRTAQELMPAGSIYELPRNKVVELSIPGGLAPGFPHPVHLHGHEFYVVRSAGSQVYNYANPVRRDVVSTGGPGDNVTIRFRSDNAGVWFLHCHIDPHLEAGFAVVFAEIIPDIGRPAPPASWDDLCPTWDNLNSEDAKLVNGNGTDTALVSSLLEEASASPTPTTTELLTSPTIITDAPTSLSEDGADLETIADSSTPTASATPTA